MREADIAGGEQGSGNEIGCLCTYSMYLSYDGLGLSRTEKYDLILVSNKYNWRFCKDTQVPSYHIIFWWEWHFGRKCIVVAYIDQKYYKVAQLQTVLIKGNSIVNKFQGMYQQVVLIYIAAHETNWNCNHNSQHVQTKEVVWEIGGR